MNKFLVQAESGRRVGSIGVFGPVAVMVRAENKGAALIEAYNHIEHLQGITVEAKNECSLNGASDFLDKS